MTLVYPEMILSSLDELADVEFQWRVWVKGDTKEVSSFTECVCGLFDDSVLGHALDKEEIVFSEQIDTLLRQLEKALAEVDETRWPAEIVADPQFVPIRDLARLAARMIRSESTESRKFSV
jgi:hypothetical protein